MSAPGQPQDDASAPPVESVDPAPTPAEPAGSEPGALDAREAAPSARMHPESTRYAGVALTAPPALPMAFFVAWLLLVSSLFGRALAPALPGARAGFEAWISAGERIGAIFSQAALIAGTLTTVVLLLSTLRAQGLGLLYRLLAAVLGAGVLTVVMSAHRQRIRAESVLVVALATGVLAAWASVPALKSPRTRGPALVLLCAAGAALSHVCARALALYASDNALVSLFNLARSVATVGLIFDVATLCLACLWLAAPNTKRAASLLGIGALLSGVVVLASLSGAKPDASLFEVLASRSLAEFMEHPAPWVPEAMRGWLELFSFTVALVALVEPSSRRLPAVVIALAILARGSTDIPLCALSLLVGALLAPLASLPRGDIAKEIPTEQASTA